MAHQNLLLQVNFLPLVVFLDGADMGQLSVSAFSMTEAPSPSGLDTAAATAKESLTGFVLRASEWDGDRTASWVREQRPVHGSSKEDSLLSPTVVPLFPLVYPTSYVNIIIYVILLFFSRSTQLLTSSLEWPVLAC